MTTNIEYFESLYKDAGRSRISLCAFDQPKIIEWPRADEIADSVARLNRAHRQGIYHSLALFDVVPAKGRGSETDVSALLGVYLDLDIPLSDGSRYAAGQKNRPMSLDEVKGMVRSWGYPTPTAIVNTGNGLHFHWWFDKPFRIGTEADRLDAKAFTTAFNALAIREGKSAGLKIDKVSDLVRVARAPGSQNWKNPAEPKAVEIVEFDGTIRYSLSDLQAICPVAPSQQAQPPKTPRRATKTASAELASWASITAGCSFTRAWAEEASTLSEPAWFAGASIIGRCEEGETIFHKVSSAHPGYERTAASAKLKHALDDAGPRTCRSIEEDVGHEGCRTCPFKGRLTSPIQLGGEQPALVPLLANNAYDLASERFFNTQTLAPRSEKAFRVEHLHKGLRHPAEDFQRSSLALKVERCAYRPGEPRLIKDEDGGRILNVYRAPNLLRERGDCSTILAHFEEVFPDAAERDHVLNYLAFTTQNPGVKLKSALVIYGPEGGGKGTIIEWMTAVLGPHNVIVLPAEAIDNRFKDDRGNKQLLVFNEACGVSRTAMNGLKEWITEPTQMVEGKGIARHRVETPRAVILLSNHEDALAIPPGDRRYFVVKTNDTVPTTSYFDKLYENAPTELPAFAAYLATKNLASFNPHARPKVTVAKEAMARASMSDLARAILDGIEQEAGCFARDFGTAEEVISALIRTGWKGRYPSTRAVGNILAELGAAKMPRIAVAGRGKPHHHAWRNKEHWLVADRAAVERHLGIIPTPANDQGEVAGSAAGLLRAAIEAATAA